jgi:protein transport protein DSL1/ZW10
MFSLSFMLTQGILPPQKRRTAVGETLSSVLSYINDSLTLMDDISADESTFLISLYTELFTLESIFESYEPGIFCPEWLRAQYIRELLEWRMVDIMESWREGFLQGVFSKEEMLGWLRKLFQDSDARARNIIEIQRG